MQALGLIETKGLIAAIEAADAMTKSANVELVQKSKVGGGLITVVVTGDVGAVKSAVEAGVGAVNNLGSKFLISDHVIPRPHDEVQNILVDKKEETSDCKNNSNIVEISTNVEEKTESDAKVITLEKDTIVEETEEKVDTTVTTATETSKEEETVEIAEIEKADEEITETVQNDDVVDIKDTQTENVQTEIPHEEKKININIENISKNEVDKLVEEHGLDKVIAMLNGVKVTKLRRLARDYKDLDISGRTISKANKSTLIAKLKAYYKNN